MQQRAVATRETVLTAAANVFSRRGYAAATISEILREAKVTKGAAYFHFDSKEGIAQAVVAEQFNWRSPADFDHGTVQDVVDLTYAFAHALIDDPLVRAGIRLTLEINTFQHSAKQSDPYRRWIDDLATMLSRQAARGSLLVSPEAASRLIVSLVCGAQLVSEALCNRDDLIDGLHSAWLIVAPGLFRETAHVRLEPPLR